MSNLEPHLFPAHMLNNYDLTQVPDSAILVNECAIMRITKNNRVVTRNFGVLIYYGGIVIVHAVTIHGEVIASKIAKALVNEGKIDHAAVFERAGPDNYRIASTVSNTPS